MKALKLGLCFFLTVILTACSGGEFRSLSSFIDTYNRTSTEKLALTDFILTDLGSYTAFVGEDDVVLINLKESNNSKIESIKVIITKSPDTQPNESDIAAFREVLANSLIAYCSYERETANETIKAFALDVNETFYKKGELTLKKDNYYFVYYSDEVTNQLMIFNSYLTKIEETSKPVSRPFYGENFIEKD